jgi:hypothetical protein
MLTGTPEPYSFDFIEDINPIYAFTTQTGSAYAVRFKHTPYIFEQHPDLGEQTYALVIELVRPAVAGSSGSDARVGVTIAAICQHFFQKHQRIVLYICETADFKHLARVRKFDSWFRQFNNHQYLKVDTQFPDLNGITYFVSLIFQWNHPQLHTIVDAFEQLSARYTTEK